MKSYPFTSQVTYDEQGLPLYDRAIDSSFLRKVFAQYFSDGVFYKPTTALQVTVDTGMQVKVMPGSCHIQGAIGIEEAERTLTVQASETQDRIDTVVARLNLSLSARTIDLYVVTGVPAISPVAPELTRNATVWELGLANIFVAKNTATITQQRITDTRLDGSRCGLVAQTIGELDTTPYFEQVQAIIKDLEDTIAGIEGGSGFVFSVNGEAGHVTVTPAKLGDDTLVEGCLLKYSGGKLSKALAGTDYADVEVLTWTPYLQVGGATVPTMTYSKQQGWGVRIGKFVHLSANLTLKSKGSFGDAAVSLRGMPYNSTGYTSVTVAVAGGVTYPGTLHGEQNTFYSNLYCTTPEGNIQTVKWSHITDTFSMEGLSLNFSIA